MATEVSASAPISKKSKLIWILLAGVISITGGVFLRKSSWAHERWLKTLSADELTLAVHDDPNNALTLLYYGSKLYEKGNGPAAEQALERAATLDPSNAVAHTGLGSVRLRMGKLSLAKDSFERAVKLDPKSVTALLGLAQSWNAIGSPSRAIDPLEKITKLQPNSEQAWYYLGRIYGDASEASKAYDAFKRATEINPKNGPAWRDLAELAIHFSKYEEAEGYLKNAIRLDRSDAMAYYLIGETYYRRIPGEHMRAYAEQAFLGATSRDPKMAAAYMKLGQIYQAGGSWKVALTQYKKVTELNPSDHNAFRNQGICLIRLGKEAEGKKLVAIAKQLEEASREITDMEKRTRTDPSNVDLHLRLARIYVKYGNLSGAATQLQMCLQLEPNHPTARKELQEVIAKMPPEERSPSPSSPSGPPPAGASGGRP